MLTIFTNGEKFLFFSHIFSTSEKSHLVAKHAQSVQVARKPCFWSSVSKRWLQKRDSWDAELARSSLSCKKDLHTSPGDRESNYSFKFSKTKCENEGKWEIFFFPLGTRGILIKSIFKYFRFVFTYRCSELMYTSCKPGL